MENREYLKGVSVKDLCEADAAKCEGLGFDFMLESGYKILEVGDLYCIVSKNDYESFGKVRICDVVYMEHSDFLEQDFLKVDWAKIANDPEFNKPLEIKVSFVKNLYGSNETLFKGENGKYYIRQDNAREECAVWLSAFKYKGEWEDNASIRPNVTFVMGDERETVTYSNWAGPGVWEGYNKAFSEAGMKKNDRSVDSIIAEAVGRSEGSEKVAQVQDFELGLE